MLCGSSSYEEETTYVFLSSLRENLELLLPPEAAHSSRLHLSSPRSSLILPLWFLLERGKQVLDEPLLLFLAIEFWKFLRLITLENFLPVLKKIYLQLEGKWGIMEDRDTKYWKFIATKKNSTSVLFESRAAVRGNRSIIIKWEGKGLQEIERV